MPDTYETLVYETSVCETLAYRCALALHRDQALAQDGDILLALPDRGLEPAEAPH